MAKRSTATRRFRNHCFTGFCYLMLGLALIVLLSILFTLIKRGLGDINFTVFTQPTPPPGSPGGLSNAIVGSLIMSVLAMIIAIPIGVFVATYLVEFSRRQRLTRAIRFANDVLLGAPSIVMGLFIYALLVKTTGHFSAIAGALALMMIAIPMIMRATEDVLYLVSPLLRESAVALGIPRWRVTLSIIYRSARHGIVTGILLALARIMGETAPLLFTALNNQFNSLNLSQPMASLPIVIYQYAMSPYADWQRLAWTGALLVTATVLIINLIARYFARERRER